MGLTCSGIDALFHPHVRLIIVGIEQIAARSRSRYLALLIFSRRRQNKERQEKKSDLVNLVDRLLHCVRALALQKTNALRAGVGVKKT
jgi:hypothetical protein